VSGGGDKERAERMRKRRRTGKRQVERADKRERERSDQRPLMVLQKQIHIYVYITIQIYTTLQTILQYQQLYHL